jgi:hypothetical protein
MIDASKDGLEEKATDNTAEKTELSENGGSSTVIMTIGEERPGHNLVQATAGIISPATAGQQPADPNLVKISILYPKSWKKEKFFKDGDVKEVSKEGAEAFVNMGIATLVEQDKIE